MQTPLERAKSRTLKDISHVLRSAYGSFGRDVSRYSAISDDDLKELFFWGHRNPLELEVYMAQRSPSTISRWAISWNRRLCEEAEAILKSKAGDRSTLLDYCMHFGILLDDCSKVTMKAAFGEKSQREKAYIRKMELMKKKVKEFLDQMVRAGQIDSAMKVGELIESL